MQESINEAAKIIYHSKLTGALTGAGISVESGIPDFDAGKPAPGAYTHPDRERARWRFAVKSCHPVFFHLGGIYPEYGNRDPGIYNHDCGGRDIYNRLFFAPKYFMWDRVSRPINSV